MNTFNRFIVTTLLVLFASQVFATDTFIATISAHAQDGTPNTQASLTHQSMIFTNIQDGAGGNSTTITILGNDSTGCSLLGGFSYHITAICGIPALGGTSTKQNLVDIVNTAIGFSATGGSSTALDSSVLLEKTNLTGGITGLPLESQSVNFAPTSASKAGIVYKVTINDTNYIHTTTGTDSVYTIVTALQSKIINSVVHCQRNNIFVLCTANTSGAAGIFTYSSFAFDSANFNITSTNILNTNEGANLEHTLTANDTAATFSITEDTSGLFSLSGTHNNTLTFNGTNTDYEVTKSYTVKVKASTGDGDDKNTTQTITVTLVDLNDETPTAITLTGDRTIAENTRTGTELGTLSATDADADANDTFTYTSSNTKFTISNDKLKLNTTLDYENATSLSTTITVTDANSHTFDKIFNFTVGDIDDTAPTNILLSNVNLIKGQPANTLVGTLSASDVDTNTPLTFTVNDTTNFKIVNGNELRTNRSTTALGNTININITASDNTNDSAPQPFTIAITTTYIAAPVIAQFSVTQGENKGPLISKDGGEVTLSASAGTGTYTWSSADFSNTSTSKTFVFNPQSANIGTRTITLKVTAGDFSSERVLKLKLVDTYPNGRTDTNGNGISDSKESGNSDNELPAGTNKKITSPGSTRIL
ncbi:cadherin repeat domain-containing protein, partial [Bathymodiolus thermophilus thioautotrophic gill symbiont]|uniref:cadherin repeat domain-containing protein n=1 Tax=Bathymodiolus thermophilus thioautotrophic gill symbiont TaxID=2360 RepID=UPI001115FBAA